MTKLMVLRKERGLSQKELAQQIGISRQELSRLESSWQIRVRASAEKKLADIFGSQWTLDKLLAKPRLKN